MSVAKGRSIRWVMLGMAGALCATFAVAETNGPVRAAVPRELPPLPPITPRTPLAPRTTPSPSRPAPLPSFAPPVSVVRPQPASGTPSAVLTPLVSPAVPPAPAPPPLTTGLPVPAVAAASATVNPDALRWDAELKEHKAKPGETDAYFTFWLTNVSSSEVLVNRVSTSCGCTVAQLPSQPWHIPPGGGGPIQVTLHMAGKSGLISKGVTVDTSVGMKQLTVRADIPGGSRPAPAAMPVLASGMMNDTERLQNMQMALADRQVLFKNKDCAKCHADPAQGKTEGRLVYVAVCATCHNSHLRAAMVPDLRALKHPTDADYWRQWITHGRAGSMMPAFAASAGGPLDEQQINALVEFMVRAFPSRVQPTQAAPKPPVAAPVSSPGPQSAKVLPPHS